MSKTILLADDSVTIQKVVELTFMDGDYQVVAVSDGLSAVEKLQEARPDLVIADIHMPGTNGYDVCRQAKAAMPEVPVLLLVGTFEPFEEEQALAAGADGHLKKPFDSQVLLARVEELIQRSASGTLPSVAAFEPNEAMEPPSLDPPSLTAPPSTLPPLATPTPPAPAEDLHATTLLSPDAAGAGSPFESSLEPDPVPASVDLSAGFSGPQPTSFADLGSDSAELGADRPEPNAFETLERHVPEDAPAPEPEASHFPEVPFTEEEPTEEVAQPEELSSDPEPVAEEPAVEELVAQTPATEVPASEPEPIAAAPVEEQPSEVAATPSSNGSGTLSDHDIERIAQKVVELAGEKMLREVAWEVVPDLAEVVIRERIRELESQVE